MVTFLSYVDAGGSVEECVVDMVNGVEDGSHPSSRFPVPDYYRLVIKCLLQNIVPLRNIHKRQIEI